MKLLLDTHIWVWSVLHRSRLPSRVVTELEDSTNQLWLSPISLWEVLFLCRKGRLELDPNPEAWIEHKLRAVPMREAPITFQVAREMSRFQLPHRDPADNFLVATARVFDLTLVTADERLIEAGVVPVLPNR
jgi:PIN domain nuclease of toxin-antitoxin system